MRQNTGLIFEDVNGPPPGDNGLPKKLKIDVNPDQIEWGYSLNTQVIPTYGGEVVQILSTYINDMEVSGQVKSHKKAEEIFKWFVDKIEKATQTGQFEHQDGIEMTYPARGWKFLVLPISIGPLKYGRDLVVPEWSARFHVVQPDQNLIDVVKKDQEALLSARVGEEGGLLFGKATGNIGWEEDDPFRSPIAETKDGKPNKRFEDLYQSIIGGETARYETSDLGDWFNNLIPSYLQGNFDDLTTDYSRPAIGKTNTSQQSGQRNPGIKNFKQYAENYLKERTGN